MMFAYIARTVVAHPWQVIAAWVVAAIAVILFAPSLDDYTTGNQQTFLPSSFESSEAQAVGNQYFPSLSGATGSLVVVRADDAPLSPADQQTALNLATSLQNSAIPGVVSVQGSPASLSADGKAAALQVVFDGQPGDDRVNDAVPVIRGDAEQQLNGTGLVSGLTGNAAIQVDTTAAYDNADKVITIATVIVILALLGLIFRSPVIAVLPVLVIGVVLSVVTGLTAVLADLFDFQVSTSLQSILVVVLFGVGTDYIVFLLFRYRERLRQQAAAGSTTDTHREALVFSTDVVGRVVASSALTVIVAFAALLLAKLGSLTTLAPGLIVAVAVMLVTALTLIPAVFTVLGRHLFWPLGPGHDSPHTPFASIGTAIGRRPAVFAIAVGVVLIALASFASGYKSTYNTLGELPSDTPSQQAFDTLDQSFPAGALSPTQVYVVAPGPLDPASLTPLVTALTQVPGVSSVAPPRPSQDGRAALVNVVLADDPYSNASLDLVEGPIRDAAHNAVPGSEVVVGGQTSTFVDVRAQLAADTRLVFPVAAVAIALILALLLLAVLAPLNLLVCVALTFVATLGAVVLLFLHGLGYDGIDFSIPIVLYLFVVAIGTDYNILLASRLREEFRNGYTPREAARIAVSNDAPTVAAAGLILALTFASLNLTGLANLAELGFGVAIGVAIAAFAMAPILVPSLSALERRAFWWPSRQKATIDTGDDREPAVPR
ncbi:RND superfamily putative drug exporter [Rhodococcus wratislaviensis]|uniref:Membrane efflux protein n=1 Tax=Rhodococcus wratislaviensis TaxID=44752 RepID=A0AB38FI47_RHOWR|nr:MMPL family transporter [Rhodococcus wratislaviensis]REE73501.1 RND superfamily putative drug exporter [Rhodococcus wratislaviensis]SPZ41360.1 membrane efflux protein [Rhodococcus wratislaviensis]